MQKILPSAHLFEMFMPITDDERRMTEVVEQIPEKEFYRGIELGMFFQREYRDRIRKVVEENNYQLTTWATPYLLRNKLNLSSLDPELRKKSVDYAVEMAKMLPEMGTANYGIPSGDYLGEEQKEEQKKALFESLTTIHEEISKNEGMHMVLEPLDRYAYKKQLIGPMPEVAEWFKGLQKVNPNIYIHWDSAHEVLGKIDLIASLDLAQPYLAQFHLCNCIADESHPCFGDLHMDVGRAPEFKTWGFLTPEVGAEVERHAAGNETTPGIRNTYCALEVRSHPGDDLWEKEKMCREFMMATFDLAGIHY